MPRSAPVVSSAPPAPPSPPSRLLPPPLAPRPRPPPPARASFVARFAFALLAARPPAGSPRSASPRRLPCAPSPALGPSGCPAVAPAWLSAVSPAAWLSPCPCRPRRPLPGPPAVSSPPVLCAAGHGRRPPLSSCLACPRLLPCTRAGHPRALAALRLRCRLLARALRAARRPLRFGTARRAWRRQLRACCATLRATRRFPSSTPASQLTLFPPSLSLSPQGDDPE